MAKEITAYVKLQLTAGKANPAPPVGPALGQHGANIMQFCKEFNAQTQGLEPGTPIPVVITVYSDRSFTFVKKTPPASILFGGNEFERDFVNDIMPLVEKNYRVQADRQHRAIASTLSIRPTMARGWGAVRHIDSATRPRAPGADRRWQGSAPPMRIRA